MSDSAGTAGKFIRWKHPRVPQRQSQLRFSNQQRSADLPSPKVGPRGLASWRQMAAKRSYCAEEIDMIMVEKAKLGHDTNKKFSCRRDFFLNPDRLRCAAPDTLSQSALAAGRHQRGRSGRR